jgi:hypothetical protein
VSPILKPKKGHLICSKCDKKGFIKRNSKGKVQIPNKKNVDTVAKALDYHAKMFYKLYAFCSYLPYNKALEEELNIDKYLRFVPFSSHSIEEIKDIEFIFALNLSEDFDEYNNKLINDEIDGRIIDNKYYNNKSLCKIDRDLNKRHKRTVHGSSIAFLYYSISYAALRDLFYMMMSTSSKKITTEIEKDGEKIARGLLFVNLFSEYLVDKRYHIPIEKISQLMIDSVEYGLNAASTKNSFDWLICKKCFDNRRLSLFEDGKCSKCNNTKKIVSRLDPRTIKKMMKDIGNEMRCYKTHYMSFLGFMSEITNQIKNNEIIRMDYLSLFKKYAIQIMKSEKKYLNKNYYCMIHSDNGKENKKSSCMLTEDDILNIQTYDDKYIKTIVDYIEKKGSIDVYKELIDILSSYNYPNEFIGKKAYKDIASGYSIIYFNGRPDLSFIFDLICSKIALKMPNN